MEPISPTDALFLIGESREHPMHVGSLQLFQPPEDAGPHFVRESYHAMLECTDVQPAFRKHPAFFGGITNVAWSFDKDVELDYHLRRSALPEPGRVRDLLELASRLHGSLLVDHLVDAVDHNGASELVFRTGSTKAIQPGSWIVNCTGYFKADDRAYAPYLSRGGSVVSIHPRSATLHLTYVMAYFMTHLLFLGKIRDVPLYELDTMDLRNKANTAFPYALISLALHNMSLIADSVPPKVLIEFGSDINLWYPLPRRLVSTARYLRTHRRERDHQRHTLDTIAKRFDVHCGPLNT